MALSRPEAADAPNPGVGASLRRLVSAFSATLHSRAELLSHELHRERVQITRLAVLGIAALFFLTLGMITATVFVIVLFWDSQRLVAIGFLTVLYLAIGGGLALVAKRDAARAARPFAGTVEQLRKDRESLTRH
jgi:uncharacterized membrane protein YqjE